MAALAAIGRFLSLGLKIRLSIVTDDGGLHEIIGHCQERDGIRNRCRIFWLLDLATKKSRQLSRLHNSAATQSFDVTADGKQIVFDRVRGNSDIVLIDLAR